MRCQRRAEADPAFAADTNALTSSDAYGTGIAALVVDDGRQALNG